MKQQKAGNCLEKTKDGKTLQSMKLSKRLLAVAAMVTPGSVLADIGTDHAYIPIYLVENNLVPRAFAMDVNRGPLARAAEHIHGHGLDDRIETRLSDGLAALQPGEARSIVIAGMGGALTVRILRSGRRLFREEQGVCAPELILQPQSEVPQVRAYLEEAGFSVVREDMVMEEGKYYPMMKAVPGKGPGGASAHTGQDKKDGSAAEGTENIGNAADMLPAEDSVLHTLRLTFGPELLRMRHPVLHQYLLHERTAQERILKTLEQNRDLCGKKNVPPGAAAKQREAEVRRGIWLIDEALAVFFQES
ncbi:MAG: class I SAM-dependent methyltransferase [Clostridiales bacterium]|nr:class I SAM-dependent methyltransferase [Clostridiales bacterium]